MIIFDRYKDILDDFIDNSDLESLPGLIDKMLQNAHRSKGYSIGFLEKNWLDKNVLPSHKLSQLAP